MKDNVYIYDGITFDLFTTNPEFGQCRCCVKIKAMFIVYRVPCHDITFYCDFCVCRVCTRKFMRLAC